MTRLQTWRWLAGYLLTFPVTLFCVIVPQLLVLDRFRRFSEIESHRWDRFARIVILIIAACGAIGMIGNTAGAVFFLKASASYSDYAASNVTATYMQAASERQMGARASAVMLLCEFFVLLIIIVAYVFVGIRSSRKIADAMVALKIETSIRVESLKDMKQQAVAAGTLLRRRVIFTAGFTFIAFLLRLTYSVMFAVANFFSNSDIECPGFTNRCSSCYNNYTHMQIWMLYNPEFQFVIVIISQNITLLVALWGMTSGKILFLMRDKENRQGTQSERSVFGRIISLN